MRTAEYSNKYKKDLRKCVARGYDLDRLQVVFELLRHDEALPAACRPHKLSGNYNGYWECHIAPDWLLIYAYPDNETLVLVRTGTHADLFG